MKKINWSAAAVMLTLITALLVAAMSVQDLKTGFKEHCISQEEKEEIFISSLKEWADAINKNTASIDSLKYELKFLNFKQGLE